MLCYLVADNALTKHINDSSQICMMSTVESNQSDKPRGNPSSSESCKHCAQDNFEHPEVKVSHLEINLDASGNMALVSSPKAGITQKLERSSNDSKTHGMPVEVRSVTSVVSTSGNLPERGAGSERKSFPSLQSSDIQQVISSLFCSSFSFFNVYL